MIQTEWIRCVDDRLFVSNNINVDADEILNQLKNIHPNIQFTEKKT